MAWNSGYITDVNYTFGYYGELNPVRIATAATALGVRTIPVKNACELGFGQGLSINIHAAANPGIQWWGNDFNPAQAAFAQDLAAKAGANARLSDESFAEFCSRDDLPEFELIVLHGIWSWVSDENRQIIVDFIRRKLAVGGMLYISYNTLPGWSSIAPLRHIIKTHGDLMSAPAVGTTQRIGAALDFVDQLFGLNPAFTRANPLAEQRFKGMKEQNRDYLAHEYMNHEWKPMYFTEFAEWIEPAKLAYAGAMNFVEQQDSVNLTPPQTALLSSIADPMMRETVRDYIVHQQFRRDAWMRGVRRLTALEHSEAYRTLRFILTVPRAGVAMKVTGAQGEAALNEAIYVPILDFLADHQIKTVPQIEQVGLAAGATTPQIFSALGLLVGMGAIAPVQDDKVIAKARPTAERLNAAIMEQARSGGDIAHLASPVLGGGVGVNRFDQLFLLARANGLKAPAEWGRFTHDLLQVQGQKLIKSGKTLESEEENLAEIQDQAQAFHDHRLPVLKAVGVA